MNKQSGAWLGSLIALILLLSSCQSLIPIPSATITLKPTFDLPTRTPTSIQELDLLPSSTVTQTTHPTATSTPIITINPESGPDVDIFYLSDGIVNRFNLRSWTSKKLKLSDSEILEAAINPDQKLIAFFDMNGLHISTAPFSTQAPIVPTVGEAGNFVFSYYNHLAFSDQEGLKIYNIQSKAITLLKSHFRQTSDIVRISFFIPVKWSPDGKWLWIRAQHYEDAPATLFNIISGKEYDFSSCTSDIDWSPNNQTFVTTVFYSGYYGCGENNGVFVAKITGNNLAEEKIYSEDPELGVSSAASVAPSGEKIVFVQETYQNHSSLYKLLLWDFGSKKIKELDNCNNEITTPKWSEDGDELYYVIHAEKESQIISLDINNSEKNIISNLPKNTEIDAVIAEHDWLLLRISNNFPQLDNLLLINAYDGRKKLLSNIIEHDWINWR